MKEIELNSKKMSKFQILSFNIKLCQHESGFVMVEMYRYNTHIQHKPLC